jgi:hypothetical protein
MPPVVTTGVPAPDGLDHVGVLTRPALLRPDDEEPHDDEDEDERHELTSVSVAGRPGTPCAKAGVIK